MGCGVLLLLLLLLLMLQQLPAKAVAAVVRGSSGKRYSAHAIADGILHWVHTYKLCPRGISVQAASVRDWALRNGSALRKLV